MNNGRLLLSRPHELVQNEVTCPEISEVRVLKGIFALPELVNNHFPQEHQEHDVIAMFWGILLSFHRQDLKYPAVK